MSKKKNDMFEYEKKWQLYKGNEYMFRLLNNMSPKVECHCPKSYLYFKKMTKNHMQDLTKKHELMLQNKILKRKLQNSKSTVNSISQRNKSSHVAQMGNGISRSQRSMNKALEESQILWENSNMFKRICNSKSFFSTVKCYSTVRLDQAKKKPLNARWFSKNRSYDLSKEADLDCNSNCIVPEGCSKSGFVDWNEVKEELKRTNSQAMQLYKKNRFVASIGLVSIKILFQLRKLTIVIEPISSSFPNVFSIVIADEHCLSQVPFMFKSYDDMVLALKYERGVFLFRKRYGELSYSTQRAHKDSYPLLEVKPNEKEDP